MLVLVYNDRMEAFRGEETNSSMSVVGSDRARTSPWQWTSESVAMTSSLWGEKLPLHSVAV